MKRPLRPAIPPSLEPLDDARLGGFRLELSRLEPLERRSGWRRISLHLVDYQGRKASWPILEGLYSRHWLDCDIYPIQNFDGSSMDLSRQDLLRELFGLLGRTVSSHLMVSYEVWQHESPLHTLTEEALRIGIPPQATPIGELLLEAGCTAGFRDWYIAEGGSEGPRKIQAEKPSSEPAREKSLLSLAQTLIEYLSRKAPKGFENTEADCRRRALRILEETPWPEAVKPKAKKVAKALSSIQDLLGHGPALAREAQGSKNQRLDP